VKQCHHELTAGLAAAPRVDETARRPVIATPASHVIAKCHRPPGPPRDGMKLRAAVRIPLPLWEGLGEGEWEGLGEGEALFLVRAAFHVIARSEATKQGTVRISVCEARLPRNSVTRNATARTVSRI
jgi:hypothetical protein